MKAKAKKQTIQVSVTKRDIEEGDRFDGRSCPIALAIRRAMRTKSVAVIGANIIYIRKLLWKGEKRVKDFIRKFDSGQRVQPCSFTITKYDE